MPRNEETLQLQAQNYRVVLFRNPPLAEQTELGDEHDPLVEVGSRLVRCVQCDEVWPPPTGVKGWPTKTWFLCPKLCNLSQRIAARFLDEMANGTRPHDLDLEARCQDRLAGVRRNRRKKTDEHQAVDPLDLLTAEVTRGQDWHARHSEWTQDLVDEWDEFE